ncbi:restriction endonuclease subunit S [Flavobacterium sp.]|uniref:restriction endonuclease subunit S n=1 Tax=Flavobacterium sp. TaxID=239 RepID=UPI00262D28D6|nr:restriction endonuclease subunit S [Flavobacterium sp.]
MAPEMNVPRLRFPNFNEDWTKKCLSEIALRVTSKNKENNLNVLTISAQFGLVSQLEYFNKSVSAKDVTGYYLIHKNEFAYNKSYSNGYPMGAIKRLNKYEKGVVSTLYICFCFNSEMVSYDFMEQYFETGLQNSEIEKFAQEGARNHGLLNIGVNDFFKIQLVLPCMAEQTKIASFLTALDDKLQALKKKKELLEQYKMGVMQQLFSQALRFKKDDGTNYPDWEEKKLGEVCEIKKGQQLNKEELTESGDYPCINGGINPSGYTNMYNTKANTITISEGGNSCGYVNFFNVKFWSGGHNYSIEISNPALVVNNYLYQLLKFNENELMKLRVGSGLPNIQKKDLVSFALNFTQSPEEQTKIANLLSAIDEKIAHCQSELDGMERWKKGLLQQLFC